MEVTWVIEWALRSLFLAQRLPKPRVHRFCLPVLVELLRCPLNFLQEISVGEPPLHRAGCHTEPDFNKIIEIKEREAHRVRLFMDMIDQREKTLVFCATQAHALAVRDLVNQMKTSKDPNYCQRVTAEDGALPVWTTFPALVRVKFTV